MNRRELYPIVAMISLALLIVTPLFGQQEPIPEQQHATGYITFNVPGARGTVGASINSARSIAGYYEDAARAAHGFVRTPDGSITTFDAPGAGEEPFLGTCSIN